MDFYQVVQGRRSVRKYKSDKVAEDKLERILDAARWAPSGKNVQASRFVVIDDAELKAQLIPACRGQKFIAEADLIIAIAVNEEEVYQNQGNYMSAFPFDGSIAMDHLTLAAYVEGLGTCWIGAFYEDQVKEILNIPDPFRVIGLTPLGYPAKEPKNPGRKPLGELVLYNKWQR